MVRFSEVFLALASQPANILMPAPMGFQPLGRCPLDVQMALRKLGVDLTTSELDGILRIFDADGSGTIVAWTPLCSF